LQATTPGSNPRGACGACSDSPKGSVAASVDIATQKLLKINYLIYEFIFQQMIVLFDLE
jgi:hypothetical protein